MHRRLHDQWSRKALQTKGIARSAQAARPFAADVDADREATGQSSRRTPSRTPSTVTPVRSRVALLAVVLRRARRDGCVGVGRGAGRSLGATHEDASLAQSLTRPDVRDRDRRQDRSSALRAQRADSGDPGVEREAAHRVGGAHPPRRRLPLRRPRCSAPARASARRGTATSTSAGAATRRSCSADIGRLAGAIRARRDSEDHRPDPRRRVRLRQGAGRVGLEGLLRRWRVAAPVRARRRPRSGLARPLAPAARGPGAAGRPRRARGRRGRSAGPRQGARRRRACSPSTGRPASRRSPAR